MDDCVGRRIPSLDAMRVSVLVLMRARAKGI